MTKKIKDNGIGNVRTTIAFTNEANLGENMNLPLSQFSSVKDTITFLIDMYKEEGIDNNEKGEIEAIETLFKEKVTEINVYHLRDGTGIELFFKARAKAEKENISNRILELLGSRTFEKVINQIYPAFFHFVQDRQNNLKKEKELKKREAELNKREEEVEKKGKVRRSGHLTDQMLKYNYPRDKQPSLFDVLQIETIERIKSDGKEVSQIVEGINISPSETKVIDCLCKLLHDTSQTIDPKKENYYSGNMDYDLVEYGGDENTPAPKLAFTLYELTKEYKGGEAVTGKDVENVKQILTKLDSKRFLLSYIETTRKKDGGRIERKIEDFRKLIHIVKISQTEYSKEDIELSKKEETVILLNPIFRRQIDSKFILYPNDINRRTIIAYGSHNLSDIALRLRDYLIRELSSKRYQPEINLDKLYYLLAEKWMGESRKKKVKEYTQKAIDTVIALGLLLSYEIKESSTGEPKVVFTLNKDWE
jgi:hypothetical protein